MRMRTVWIVRRGKCSWKVSWMRGRRRWECWVSRIRWVRIWLGWGERWRRWGRIWDWWIRVLIWWGRRSRVWRMKWDASKFTKSEKQIWISNLRKISSKQKKKMKTCEENSNSFYKPKTTSKKPIRLSSKTGVLSIESLALSEPSSALALWATHLLYQITVTWYQLRNLHIDPSGLTLFPMWNLSSISWSSLMNQTMKYAILESCRRSWWKIRSRMFRTRLQFKTGFRRWSRLSLR